MLERKTVNATNDNNNTHNDLIISESILMKGKWLAGRLSDKSKYYQFHFSVIKRGGAKITRLQIVPDLEIIGKHHNNV